MPATPQQPIIVRPIEFTDRSALVDLLQSCHRREDGSVPRRYRSTDLFALYHDALSGICPHKPSVLVALIGGETAGTIGYARSFFAGSGWEIAYWATAPAFQGRGVGNRLLDTALIQIRHRAGLDDFVLARTSHTARFRARGFVPVPSDPSLMRAEVKGLRIAEEGREAA